MVSNFFAAGELRLLTQSWDVKADIHLHFDLGQTRRSAVQPFKSGLAPYLSSICHTIGTPQAIINMVPFVSANLLQVQVVSL